MTKCDMEKDESFEKTRGWFIANILQMLWKWYGDPTIMIAGNRLLSTINVRKCVKMKNLKCFESLEVVVLTYHVLADFIEANDPKENMRRQI